MGCSPSKTSKAGTTYPESHASQLGRVPPSTSQPSPGSSHLDAHLQQEQQLLQSQQQSLIGPPQPPFNMAQIPPPLPPRPAQASPFPFITRRGYTLLEGDSPFRFISLNTPNLLFLEDRPDCGWVLPDPWEQYDALKTIALFGGRVTRTYCLGAENGQHMQHPRQYNEDCFVTIDHALAKARDVGVRLIIPLVNNYGGKDQAGGECGHDALFGNYMQYAKHRNKKPSQFFTDPELIDDFKHMLSFLLNRINTVNGVRYGDDPTVLAWQLGNELGGWKGPNPPTSWTLQMTSFIRSLAPRTLVADGTMGGLEAKTKWDKQALASPDGPDIFVNHYYYGESDLKRLKEDSAYVAKHGKAFVVGEFGFSNVGVYGRIYEEILRNDKISGSLIWSLRFHSMFGGFYVHGESGGKYSAYHAPGFRARNHGFCAEEADVMPQIRHYALRIQGYADPNSVPMPIPEAPWLLNDIRPGWIRFRGAAWAARYVIWRGTAVEDTQGGQGINWDQHPLASDILDDVCSGSTIWKDMSAAKGVPYYYAVQAVGVGGGVSPWSNVVGPVYA
ncbi:glycoside hydrolase superfamily [Phlyctochytrium arcticum]|nr:glycoside hydrolase superfamily [Phlyctochytrium arcticum]